MRRFAALILSFLLVLPALGHGYHGTEKPFLWMIGEDPPSFVYGTIHLPDERVLALPEVVMEAFDAADALYTEIPMDMASQMAIAPLVLLEGDQTLADILPEPLYARCDSFLQTRGMQMAMVGKMKVWALAAQIGLIDYLEKLQTTPALDSWLYLTATDRGKELGALETATYQVEVMDSIALEDQIALLADGLKDIIEGEAEGISPLEELILAYLAGDADDLFELMYATLEEDPALGERFLEALLYERNRGMAEAILLELEEDPDKVHFFAVGAAHAPGEKGVLPLLEEAGVKVRRLDAGDLEFVRERLPEVAGSR